MYVERYPRDEERLSAAVHVFGVLLSIVGLVFLIIQANSVGRAGSLPVVIVYGATLMLLFSFSSVHHAAILPRIKQAFLVLDHCGIYLLIAGTYTPFSLLMPVGQRWILLAIIWGLALAGIVVQLVAFLIGRGDSYERFAYFFYLAIAWIPILWAGEYVLKSLPPMGLDLLVAGGVAYSIGVIFYVWKRIQYAHAIWHLFVVGGSVFHFFSIFYYVVPDVL
ncbi:MAG: hemolysin III family protein [Rhodospirillaceae bacterium]|nr:hemolysin III family protein [Rhodospirillaceae bacterium]